MVWLVRLGGGGPRRRRLPRQHERARA